jgi:AcrR family transcriptional regulator
MDVAEKLFFTHGYDSVSVRDITQSANANVASVNYHFNSKKDLYRDVFRRKLKATSGRMLEVIEKNLNAIDTPDEADVIRIIVGAFITRFLQSKDSENFLTIISQEMSESGIARDIFLEEAVYPIHKKFRETITSAHPGIKDEELLLCISSIFGQIFHFIRAKSVIRLTIGREYDEEFIKTIINHITQFSVSGIRGYSS